MPSSSKRFQVLCRQAHSRQLTGSRCERGGNWAFRGEAAATGRMALHENIDATDDADETRFAVDVATWRSAVWPDQRDDTYTDLQTAVAEYFVEDGGGAPLDAETVATRYGPTVRRILTVETPVPDPGDVAAQAHAAADIIRAIREALPPPPSRAPTAPNPVAEQRRPCVPLRRVDRASTRVRSEACGRRFAPTDPLHALPRGDRSARPRLSGDVSPQETDTVEHTEEEEEEPVTVDEPTSMLRNECKQSSFVRRNKRLRPEYSFGAVR